MSAAPRRVRTTASALVIRTRPVISPETDTGHRLIRGQVATAYGRSCDDRWLFLEAPAGAGWASAAYLEDAPAAAPPSGPWPPVPHGLPEIRAVFGEPATAACTAGRVTLPASLPLSWDPAQSVSSFACHELVQDVMASAFREVHRRGLWHHLEDFGGCFNDRPARGLQKRSTHAWGIAVDVAVRRNPLGARPTLNPRVVAIFEDHGFLWGGRWSRPDGMHFQYASGY